MNSSKWLHLIAFIGVACVGLGLYPACNKSNDLKQGQTVTTINVSLDGKSCTVLVPATAAYGINCIDPSTGRKFEVRSGDEVDVSASGYVKVGVDRPTVGPEGETSGYFDHAVDSPYTQNVGGLEMWIGIDRRTNRYLVGSHLQQKVSYSGVPSFRVIDVLPHSRGGYRGTGAFTVTITKK